MCCMGMAAAWAWMVGSSGYYETTTLGVSSAVEGDNTGDGVSLAEDLHWAE
jgi:hypothetical protein